MWSSAKEIKWSLCVTESTRYKNRYSTWMRNYLKLSRVYVLSAVTVTWFGFTSVTKKWRTKRAKSVSVSWEIVSERW
jgi:hypothetical protein